MKYSIEAIGKDEYDVHVLYEPGFWAELLGKQEQIVTYRKRRGHAWRNVKTGHHAPIELWDLLDSAVWNYEEAQRSAKDDY